MRFPGWIVVVMASASVPTGVVAAQFQSGPDPVALIELYTSEGCSSCPPAERWLGELRHDTRLWREFVPIAFHVLYWDHLGWKDRYAAKRFTERQYALARAWEAGRVYTPCFARNGREWRPREPLPAEKSGNRAGELRAETADAGEVRVTFQPAEAGGRFEASVALLGGDIRSHVKAGENSGRTLGHEFVALTLQSIPLQRTPGGRWTGRIALARDNIPATPRRALAVWVTRFGELAPIQATGGWLE